MDTETDRIIAELQRASPKEFYGSMLIAWNNGQYWIAAIAARKIIAYLRANGFRPWWLTETRLATVVTIGRESHRKLGKDPMELLA